MSDSLYGDLISRNITKKSLHKEVKGPKIEFGTEKFSGGTDLDISWYCPPVPVPISDKIHTHEFDEFLCFLPSNPFNLGQYQSEVEFALGAEAEKQVLAEPSIIYLPRGLPHGGLNFKTIDVPVSYMKICLSARYSANPKPYYSNRKQYITYPQISTEIHKLTYYVNDQPLGTEENSVPKITYAGQKACGASLNISWYIVNKPLVLYSLPHSHQGKEYQLFMGGNAQNVDDFAAEAMIYLGPEAETHLIDSTSIVHIREGLLHRKIEFKRVDRPVILVKFSLEPANPK
jgi:hypothetical protein